MLANSAATLPRGHFLIEPYLYDVRSSAHFDHDRTRQRTTRSDSYGSLTYMLYGVVDRASVGLVPTFSFNTQSGGLRSSNVGIGDVSVMAQFRLTANDPYSRVPTISVNVQETLPTGKYDRLGSRSTDGFGSGAYATTVALYTQKYFWLPNGRIMRMRMNVSESYSGRATIEDESVYGTEQGFRGTATPGRVLFLNGAWEYSLTRNWVLALDATYRHAGSTEVAGYRSVPGGILSPTVTASGISDAVGLAPAIEYNVTGNFGVLFGARVIAAGRNTSASITPAIAFNIVH
jgi:hypothetical protein